MTEKVFISGISSFDITDKIPEYILGHGGINPEMLKEWLEENKKYAVDGWIPYQVKMGKNGKRYFEVDMWKVNKPKRDGQDLSGYEKWQASMDKALPVIQQDEPVDVSGIPF